MYSFVSMMELWAIFYLKFIIIVYVKIKCF